MPKLPRIKPKQVIKALKRAGFYIDRVSGSHHIMYKDDISPPVSIPFHNKDIKTGTLSAILKQVGLRQLAKITSIFSSHLHIIFVLKNSQNISIFFKFFKTNLMQI